MAGAKKRSSDEAAGPTTRSSKAAKTDGAASASKAASKKGAKAALPSSAFKSQALPLHVNITHTPPTIPDEETVPAAPADPGFLGAVTLVPSSFATGSYGWKGSKRITVELENPGEGEDKEKVQVMLTYVFSTLAWFCEADELQRINATVVGSKQAPHDDAEEEAKADPQETEEKAAGVPGAESKADEVD
ncbi:hypothetical protein HGRIS_013644 [Hohenbuehelia grisea]|uniref:Uncharacterized protein n=1 Tax=Hohenbuehelia grisea TaxID=104357 RepID=A0ABR3IW98_9AGAR